MIVDEPWMVELQVVLNVIIGLLFLLTVLTVIPKNANLFSSPFTLIAVAMAGAAAGFFHLQLAYFLGFAPDDVGGGFQFTYAALFMNLQMSLALVLLNGIVIARLIQRYREKGKK